MLTEAPPPGEVPELTPEDNITLEFITREVTGCGAPEVAGEVKLS